MLDETEVYRALRNIVKNDLSGVEANDVVTLAIAVWHEGFVPDINWIENLDQKSQRIAGYVIEFLAGFNVLCREERERLLAVAEKLRPPNVPYTNPDDHRDELATQWGLEHDIVPYFEHISYYQTRHYKHNSEYKRPSSNFTL